MNDTAYYFSFKSGSGGHGHGHGHSGHGKGKGKHGHHHSTSHHHNWMSKPHKDIHSRKAAEKRADKRATQILHNDLTKFHKEFSEAQHKDTIAEQRHHSSHLRALARKQSHPRHIVHHRNPFDTPADQRLHDLTSAQQHAADEQGRMGQDIANKSTENLGVTDPHSLGMNMGNYASSFYADNLSSFNNNINMSGVIDEVKSHSTLFVDIGLVGLGALLLLPKLGVKAIPQQYNKLAWIGTLASLGIGIFSSVIPSHLSFQGREHGGGGGGGHGGGGGGGQHAGTSGHDPLAGHPSGFGMGHGGGGGHEGGEHHGGFGGHGEHGEHHGGFGGHGEHGEHHGGFGGEHHGGFGHERFEHGRFGHGFRGFRHSYPYYYPYNGPFGYIPDVYPGYPAGFDPFMPYPGYPYMGYPGYPYMGYPYPGYRYPYHIGRGHHRGFHFGRGHRHHGGHHGHHGGHEGGEHHGGHGGGHRGGHEGGEHAHLAYSNFSPAIFPDRSEELLGIKRQHHMSLVPEMKPHQLLNPSDILLPEEIITDEYILGSRNPIDDSNHTPPTLLSDIY